MTRADIVAYCLAKPGAWLDEPWEGDQVVKVADKIFAFLGSVAAAATSVGVKCGRSADDAAELRAQFPADATVSAYIGRYGWNTLRVGAGIPDEDILEAVDASYDAVLSTVSRAKRP
jgi:predicted DNA-binding protein (MmcQ/YjbR family)